MENNIELVEKEKYWELKFNEKTITGLFLDFSFALNVYDRSNSVYITISNVFKYYDSTLREEFNVDPEKIESLAPVLRIFQKEVQVVFLYKNGDLFVQFEDESTIMVEADAEYEAWKISDKGGSEGILIFSLPERGGLEIYCPEE